MTHWLQHSLDKTHLVIRTSRPNIQNIRSDDRISSLKRNPDDQYRPTTGDMLDALYFNYLLVNHIIILHAL